MDDFCWYKLCENKEDWAIDYIIKNMDKLTPDILQGLCLNKNPRAIRIIKEKNIKLSINSLKLLAKNDHPEVLEILKLYVKDFDENSEIYDDLAMSCHMELILDNIDNIGHYAKTCLYSNNLIFIRDEIKTKYIKDIRYTKQIVY
jgi:hypothetical protein